MKKLAIILILLASLLFTSGCAEKAQEKPTDSHNILNDNTDSQNILNKSAVVEATRLKQINSYLQKGPVLLKIGAEWCDDCKAMKPILAQVAVDYEGKVTVMSADIDKSPKLADYFGANVIPVSFVIIGIKNGNYTYMREDGNVSTDEFKAKIIGSRDKEVLETVLDTALQKEKNKYK